MPNLSRKPIDITSDVIVMVGNWHGAIYTCLESIKPLPAILTEGNAKTNTWLSLRLEVYLPCLDGCAGSVAWVRGCECSRYNCPSEASDPGPSPIDRTAWCIQTYYIWQTSPSLCFWQFSLGNEEKTVKHNLVCVT